MNSKLSLEAIQVVALECKHSLEQLKCKHMNQNLINKRNAKTSNWIGPILCATLIGIGLFCFYLGVKSSYKKPDLSIVETTEFGRIKSVAPSSSGYVLVTTDKMVVKVQSYTLNTFPFDSVLTYNKYSDGTGEWTTLGK